MTDNKVKFEVTHKIKEVSVTTTIVFDAPLNFDIILDNYVKWLKVNKEQNS